MGRLKGFRIDMGSCYFAARDGSENMLMVVATGLNLQSQICMTHGLHVALRDSTLYQKE